MSNLFRNLLAISNLGFPSYFLRERQRDRETERERDWERVSF